MNHIIDSPTNGYFHAHKIQGGAEVCWEIRKKGAGNKQIGTFYAGTSYLPYRSVALTIWELQELYELLKRVTQDPTAV